MIRLEETGLRLVKQDLEHKHADEILDQLLGSVGFKGKFTRRVRELPETKTS